MRIGVNALLLREEPTGVERYIIECLRALGDEAREHDVLAFVRPGYAATLVPPSVRTVPSPLCARSRLTRIALEHVWLPHMVRRLELDVLVAPAYVLPVGTRCRTILVVHDLIALSHPRLCTLANRTYYRLAVPSSIRRADHILTVSEATRRELVTRFPETDSRSTVVSPGLAPRFRIDVPGGDVVRSTPRDRPILHVGNIEPKKDVETLVAAYATLRAQTSHAGPLILAGAARSGGDRIRSVVRSLGIEPWVRLTGHVTDDALASLYREAGAVVLSSLVEGFGFPILEAMAAGAPIVASDIPAFREVAARHAIYFRPRDAKRLAGALAEALASDRPCPDAKRHALAFRWEDTARAILALCESSHDELPTRAIRDARDDG